MRYLYFAESSGAYPACSCGVTQTEPLTFPLRFLVNEGKLLLRSVKFGNVIAVCMRQSELTGCDDVDEKGVSTSAAGDAAAAQAATESISAGTFCIVASDEGHTETTLFRIANVVVEMSLFLGMEQSYRNVPIMRRFLMYISHRMATNDLSFLCLSVGQTIKIAVAASGMGDRTTLMDSLLEKSYVQDHRSQYRHPGYACTMFGDKLLIESSTRWAQQAVKLNLNVKVPSLTYADKFLLNLLSSALYATPSTSPPGPLEKEIHEIEQALSFLGIHRYNVTCESSRDLFRMYCEMLRSPGGLDGSSTKPVDDEAAQNFEMLFCRLEQLYQKWTTYACTETGSARFGPQSTGDDLVPKNASDISVTQGSDNNHSHLPQFLTIPNDEYVYSTFHHKETPLDQRAYGDQIRIDGIFLQGTQISTTVLMTWVPFLNDPNRAHEESEMMKKCPQGYVVSELFFPSSEVEDDATLSRLPLPPADVGKLLSRDAMTSMEPSFNCMNWLLIPNVSSCNTQGLIAFLIIDRRTNFSTCVSFECMKNAADSLKVQAVDELQAMMAHCISRAHELLAQGFSEGLWGHLGMQFFFAITNTSSKKLPLFSPETKKISMTGDELLDYIVLRPYILPDAAGLDYKVTEIYAMFIGAMSPEEVVSSAEQARQYFMPEVSSL